MLRRLLPVLCVVLLLMTAAPAAAQCPMCKTNVAAAMKTPGNMRGRGLNTGILYLLMVPYLLGGGAVVVWYTQFRRETDDDVEPAL